MASVHVHVVCTCPQCMGKIEEGGIEDEGSVKMEVRELPGKAGKPDRVNQGIDFLKVIL